MSLGQGKVEDRNRAGLADLVTDQIRELLRKAATRFLPGPFMLGFVFPPFEDEGFLGSSAARVGLSAGLGTPGTALSSLFSLCHTLLSADLLYTGRTGPHQSVAIHG